MKRLIAALCLCLVFISAFHFSAIAYSGSTTVYVMDGGTCYHFFTCECLTKGSMHTTTIEQAAHDGYSPCRVCKTPPFMTDYDNSENTTNNPINDKNDDIIILSNNSVEPLVFNFMGFVFTKTELLIVCTSIVASILCISLIVLFIVWRTRNNSHLFATYLLSEQELDFIYNHLESGSDFSAIRRSFNKEFNTKFSASELSSLYRSTKQHKSEQNHPEESKNLHKIKVKVKKHSSCNNINNCVFKNTPATVEDKLVSVASSPVAPYITKCPNCKQDILSDCDLCPHCYCTFPEIYKRIADCAQKSSNLRKQKYVVWVVGITIILILSIAIPKITDLISPLPDYRYISDDNILRRGLISFLLVCCIYGGGFRFLKFLTHSIDHDLSLLELP